MNPLGQSRNSKRPGHGDTLGPNPNSVQIHTEHMPANPVPRCCLGELFQSSSHFPSLYLTASTREANAKGLKSVASYINATAAVTLRVRVQGGPWPFSLQHGVAWVGPELQIHVHNDGNPSRGGQLTCKVWIMKELERHFHLHL